MSSDDAQDGPLWLDGAHFGYVGFKGKSLTEVQDVDPDDEELPGGTPPDVVMMLGFDPSEWADEE